MFKKLLKKFLILFQDYFRKNTSLAINKLHNLEGINYLDIGAAGEVSRRWNSVSQHVNYFGFEPDDRSYSELCKEKNNYKSYNLKKKFVWDSNKKLSFYLCKKPELSSALIPNLEILNIFPESPRFDVESEVKIDADSLDNCHKDEVDFIKIDVQGGELNILKGAENLLKNTLGIELEIEFVQIYKNQPLFGEIQEWLTLKDFEFIDFLSLYRWGRRNLDGNGQCVFTDALFLKIPEKIQFESLSKIKISAYLSILLIYKRFDLIEKTIDLLMSNDKNVYKNFMCEVYKIQKLDNRINTLNNYFNKILNILGQNYRSHILY